MQTQDHLDLSFRGFFSFDLVVKQLLIDGTHLYSAVVKKPSCFWEQGGLCAHVGQEGVPGFNRC